MAGGRGEADAAGEHLRHDLQPADDQGRRVEPFRFGRGPRSHQVLADLGADAVAHRFGLARPAGPAAAPRRRGCRRCAGSGWRGRTGAGSAPARRRYAGPGRTARSCAPGSGGRAGSRSRPRLRDSPSRDSGGRDRPGSRPARPAAPRRGISQAGTGSAASSPQSRRGQGQRAPPRPRSGRCGSSAPRPGPGRAASSRSLHPLFRPAARSVSRFPSAFVVTFLREEGKGDRQNGSPKCRHVRSSARCSSARGTALVLLIFYFAPWRPAAPPRPRTMASTRPPSSGRRPGSTRPMSRPPARWSTPCSASPACSPTIMSSTSARATAAS